mgnify:CR=1 FL=1
MPSWSWDQKVSLDHQTRNDLHYNSSALRTWGCSLLSRVEWSWLPIVCWCLNLQGTCKMSSLRFRVGEVVCPLPTSDIRSLSSGACIPCSPQTRWAKSKPLFYVSQYPLRPVTDLSSKAAQVTVMETRIPENEKSSLAFSRKTANKVPRH